MKPILPWAREDVRRALDVQRGGPVCLAGPALALEEVLPLQPLSAYLSLAVTVTTD